MCRLRCLRQDTTAVDTLWWEVGGGGYDPYSMTASVKLSAFLPNAFSSTHYYSSGILIRETQEVHSILNFLREMDL